LRAFLTATAPDHTACSTSLGGKACGSEATPCSYLEALEKLQSQLSAKETLEILEQLLVDLGQPLWADGQLAAAEDAASHTLSLISEANNLSPVDSIGFSAMYTGPMARKREKSTILR
jgi:hypothetical protein